MRFWWVNQNQTFQQETAGGYLWSPKRKSNGSINPFYEFMRAVSPGDLVFSFQKTFIRAIGVIRSSAYECPKPTEFGSAGRNWSNVGWMVDAKYFQMANPIRPSNHMTELSPHMPKLYAPLQVNGQGLQGVYLTFLTPMFAKTLARLLGPDAEQLVRQAELSPALHDSGTLPLDTAIGLVEWEEHLLHELSNDQSIPETEREAVVIARRGQGRFKQNVMQIEQQCRVTKVDRIEHLRASHIRPWRDCPDHRQRLDGENGFLLTPSIDHLFDRGFISFENSGKLIVSPVAHRESLKKIGISDESMNVGGFSEGQRRYLDFHRDNVFLKARVRT